MHLRNRVYLAVATVLALLTLVGTATAQGTLNLRIEGLSGATGDVVIRNASRDVVATLTASASLTLPEGRYTVSASASGAYRAIHTIQTVYLPAAGERDVEVRYEMSPTGSAEQTQLVVTVSGLPDGTAADLRLHGAHGVDDTYDGAFIRHLYAGSYTVTAQPVGDYEPTVGTHDVIADPRSMDPGSYGAIVDVVYGPAASEEGEEHPETPEDAASGIRLTVHGPQGPGTGDVSVISVDGTGHGGSFTDDADVPLPPGRYLVLGSGVGGLMSDPYRQTVEVDEDEWLDVEVRYPRADGSLRVRTAGLPERMTLYLDIEGQQGPVFSDNAGQDLSLHLPEGRYVVTPRDVPGYLPREARVEAVVPAEGTVIADLVFEPEGDRDTTTRMALRATGVPGDTGVTIYTTAEDGSDLTIHGVTSAPVTFSVPAGRHDIDPQGLPGFVATVIPAEVDVAAGATTEVEVRYEKEGATPEDAGALDVSLIGLPNGVDGDVRVTGPGGFDVNVTASDRLLVPEGVYLATANPVAGFLPEPSEQAVKVVPLQIVPLEVHYASTGEEAVLDPSHECTPYQPTPAGRSVARTWSQPNERDLVDFSVPGDLGGGWAETKLMTNAPAKPWAVTTAAGTDAGAIGSGGTDGHQRIDVFEVAPGQAYVSEVRAFVNAPLEEHPWPWTWSWTFHSRVDCYEPNDTIAEAKTIPLDTDVEAYLIAGHVTNGIAANAPRTYDWYRFELEEETTVTLHVHQLPANTRWSARLFTADERQVGGAIRGARGETVSGDLGTLAAGSWYLEIHPSPDLRHAVPSSGHAIPDHFNVPYIFELEGVEP